MNLQKLFPLQAMSENLPNDAQQTKRAVVQFASNVGLDQPARMRRLIRAFVAHLRNQWTLQYTSMNRECSDQTARLPTLIWAFAVRLWQKIGILPRCASNVLSPLNVLILFRSIAYTVRSK